MFSVLSFVIAFAAAYWVYNDARGRGHEQGPAILWALGTFAMLIVFLPLYLIFGRKPNLRPTRRDDVIDVEATPVNENTMHCPMCAAKVNEDFKVCPYCGYTLKPKCEHCGQELRREWKVCPHCQTPTAPK